MKLKGKWLGKHRRLTSHKDLQGGVLTSGTVLHWRKTMSNVKCLKDDTNVSQQLIFTWRDHVNRYISYIEHTLNMVILYKNTFLNLHESRNN